MKKLLYITDQQEYSEHGSIGPIFNKYLSEHLEIDIVYFTKYKSDFQKNGNHYIIPEFERRDILGYLEKNDVNVDSYEYVFVRNMEYVLKDILLERDSYNYKVGYRISFPKRLEQYEALKAEQKSSILDSIDLKIKQYNKKRIINKCDLFMPTTKEMQTEFYDNVTINSFPIPPGVDPEDIREKETNSDDLVRFVYAGTVDELRKFETILKGFSWMSSKNWTLKISTFNPANAEKIVDKYPDIKGNIEITKAKDKDELFSQISSCDVGISLLPNTDLYNTATPAKIMDYYSCGVPVIMTNNSKNSSIFTDNENAWFCSFEEKQITERLEDIVATKKEKFAEMGNQGKEVLLDIRNYKKLAKDLFEALEKI